MRFNKNKNRNFQYLKVKDLRTKEKGVSQCIVYTLTKRVGALSKGKISKLSKIIFYNCSKYKIIHYRSIRKLLIHFVVFITVVFEMHNKMLPN